MTNTTQIQNSRNSLEILKWLVFEPEILKRYADPLGRRQLIRIFMKTYMWIVLFLILVWLSVNITIATVDIPSLHPGLFKKDFSEVWQTHTGWFSKFMFLSKKTTLPLSSWLALGLFLGLALGLTHNFAVGLAIVLGGGLGGALAGGLGGALAGGLAGALGVGLAGGLIGGFAFGLAFGSAFGLGGGLAFGPGFGLGVGLVYGLAFGLASGLGVGGGTLIGSYISYFRMIFYPVHFVKSLLSITLSDNPFLKDGLIWLPIPGLKSKLVKHAKKEPVKAFEFIDFLMGYRPLQKTLAMHLTHAATAGLWIKNEFHSDIIKITPIISKDRPKFQPTEGWMQKLTIVRKELVAFEQQSSIGYKLDYFQRYLVRLNEFEQITLRKESSRWNYYYFDVLKKWIQIAEEECESLKLSAKTQEPVTKNVYRSGGPLNPEFDKNIFIGRRDLKEDLQNKILSSHTMPMFLIHGQRRVGKTSLLKFLPEILGIRFKVVYMDLQPIGSIFEWLRGLKKEFDYTLGIDFSKKQETQEKNWLEKWKELQNYLEEAVKKEECKIILAFDEYEKVHYYFQKDPEAAKNLLGAMRSFSQHQNKIVFLFVGTALFTELKEPNWSNYFVQTVLLRVDYLKKEETFKLIRVANLEYPQEVLESIYHLTRGHPTLVQRICQEMVNIANTQNRKAMTMEDLEEILEKHIYRQQNGVTEVFWGQFCQVEAMKTTVRQIIDGETPTNKKSLFTLKEHGFIIKEKAYYKMRVPIFENWVRQFGEVV